MNVVRIGPLGRGYPKGFAWVHASSYGGAYRWALAVYRARPGRYPNAMKCPSSLRAVHVGCRERPTAYYPAAFWPCVMAGRAFLCGAVGLHPLPDALASLPRRRPS